MARINPQITKSGLRALKKDPRLVSKYLDRTRSQRLAQRTNGTLGFKFFLLLLLFLFLTGSAMLFAEVASAFAIYSADLPPVGQLSQSLSFKTTQILDRNGQLLYEVDDQNGGRRLPVHLGSVSQSLIDATIATEDKDFYSNAGVDPAGIARAVWQNTMQGQLVQGASTITQQLAKNVLIDQETRDQKSYIRKIQEAVLAYRISQTYSKDEILEMYLNEVYYGHLSYGIEAAAQTYFGKHAGQLNLAESSLLAGLPQAPSEYDPFIHLGAARERQSHVLDRMVEQGYITQETADQAKRASLNLLPQRSEPFDAPHFVMYVRQLLEQKYGGSVVYHQGLKVTTTLDLKLNKIAENAMRANLDALKTQNANNAGLVSIDPKTGEILAMVGSKDYNDNSIAGEVNMATSPRQPGSTIKPIEYSLALMKGWGPETIILDTPTAFPNTQPYLPPYEPHNFDYNFAGPMTVRYALANSKNIPAIKALMFDTIPDFLQFAGRLGIQFQGDPNVYGLSLGLGAGSVSLLNMVGAYAALDNYGRYHPPVAILKVQDWEGNVLEQYDPPAGEQVVSPAQAYMITSILSDNWARTPLQGPTSPLLLSRPNAAKTGSTDDYKDSWTIGYTPELATGVWVGNTDNKPMKEVLGSLGAGRIWHSYMEEAIAGTPVHDFVPPPGIKEVKACLKTAQPLAAGPCEGPVLTEVYPEGYTQAQYAFIPGLDHNTDPRDFQLPPSAKFPALGMTVSSNGMSLQPTPTPVPGETPAPPQAPTPTPLPGIPAPYLAPPAVETPGPALAPAPGPAPAAGPPPAAAPPAPAPAPGG